MTKPGEEPMRTARDYTEERFTRVIRPVNPWTIAGLPWVITRTSNAVDYSLPLFLLKPPFYGYE